jgi:PilZ domain
MEQPDKSVFADAAASLGESDSEIVSRDRDSLLLLADLRIDGRGDPISVRVRNLSAGGLMAELPHPIRTDRGIEIDLRGVGRVAGRVAWQTAGRIGVAFDRPIDPQMARKPVGAAPRREPPRFGG